MNPKVSVIVPNYNHEGFLKRRLDSIFNQSFQDFELIILDDFSQDNSKEVILNYSSNPKVSHVVYNSHNSGSTFIQWNKGIELAKGEWIWIAESDDYSELNFLSEMIQVTKNNHKVGMIYSNSFAINHIEENLKDEKDNPKVIPRNIDNRYMADFSNNGKLEVLNHMLSNNTIPNASAVLFKKELYNKNYLNFKLRLCGDWLFWIEILSQTDIYFISKPLNYFRFHTNNVRSSVDNILVFKEYLVICNYLINNYVLDHMSKKTLIDSLVFKYKTLNVSGFRLSSLIIMLWIGYKYPIFTFKRIFNLFK